jgi:sugar lactone lactonase YvrE
MLTSILLAILTAPPVIESVAGDGKAGFRGDGGKATEASLNQPFHCELDARGNLLIAEAFNHCIRKVDLKTGIISTVAGTGKKGYTGDGGPANRATFNEPYAVVGDEEGSLYIADRLNAVIRKVDGKSGIISTIAGTGKPGYSGDDGPGTKAMLREPNDVHLDGRGGLLIADVADWRVRRLDLKTGIITTFAGIGPRGRVTKAELGDEGPANKAVVYEARAVCVDGGGNTYICERRGNCIRRVDAKGTITTIAGSRELGADDGPGLRATFHQPKGIRADRAGNLFIVDTENHSIRRIEAKTRQVTTVAGGRKGNGGDGGDAAKAGLDRPHGCVIDRDGIIYIADSNNHRVRRVRPPPP